MEKSGSRVRSVLKAFFAYGGVFFVSFALTLYWSFPYELVAKKVFATIHQRSGLVVTTSSIRPYWLVGLQADGVTLKQPARRPGEPPLSVSLSSVTARLKPIDSLFGGLAIAFDATAPEGHVSGTVQEQKDKAVHVALDVHSLDVGKIPDLWDALGIGFTGNASGTFTATITPNHVEKTNGLADLTISKAKFGGGMIRGFTVPGVDLGDVHLQAAIEKGVVRLEPPLKIAGKDLDARVSGTLRLRPILVTSGMDLKVAFRPTERFWKANGTLASIGKSMLRGARQPDGYYGYRMTGVVGHPRFLPSR